MCFKFLGPPPQPHGHGMGSHLALTISAPDSTMERVANGDSFMAKASTTLQRWQQEADQLSQSDVNLKTARLG